MEKLKRSFICAYSRQKLNLRFDSGSAIMVAGRCDPFNTDDNL